MRVLLVNRFFGGEQVPTGRMSLDLAEEIKGRGHVVEILTSRDSYAGAPSGSRSEHDSSINRVWSGPSTLRIVQWLFFWLQACIRIPAKRWDRCVILTDPPFMQWASLVCGAFGRRGLYWWTMDLYPEALVAGGRIKPGGFANGVLSAVNRQALRFLDGVICLGPRQRQRLARYEMPQSKPDHVIEVPPWDHRPLPLVPRELNRFRREHGLAGKRIALYAGNLGEAHCFEPLLAAASSVALAGDELWHFVFAVRGSRRNALESQAKSLRNVSVLDYQTPEMTLHMLWAADVHVITMREGWEGIVVPSKLYGVTQTCAPILFIGPEDADTAQEIRKYDLGTTVPARSPVSDVIDALHRCSFSRQSLFGASDGPRRVADFVCRQ